MAANLVEKLNEAIEACEEISAKDLKSQKERIAEMFGKLQKAVYEIVDEKGIILANCKWVEGETETSNSFNDVLNAEAKRISMHMGVSEELIKEILEKENAYKWTRQETAWGMFILTCYKYNYLTIEI